MVDMVVKILSARRVTPSNRSRVSKWPIVLRLTELCQSRLDIRRCPNNQWTERTRKNGASPALSTGWWMHDTMDVLPTPILQRGDEMHGLRRQRGSSPLTAVYRLEECVGGVCGVAEHHTAYTSADPFRNGGFWHRTKCTLSQSRQLSLLSAAASLRPRAASRNADLEYRYGIRGHGLKHMICTHYRTVGHTAGVGVGLFDWPDVLSRVAGSFRRKLYSDVELQDQYAGRIDFCPAASADRGAAQGRKGENQGGVSASADCLLSAAPHVIGFSASLASSGRSGRRSAALRRRSICALQLSACKR